MDAKELRIGNYYAIAENDAIKYKQIKWLIESHNGFFSGDDNITLAAKPIHLNYQWLPICGFHQHGQVLNLLHNYEVWIEVNGSVLYLKTETGRTKVKYVHQLQNLYFVLTGEELDIDL